MKKALLIIDLQTGLFEQRPFDFSNTIYNVETLIRYANENDYPVIVIQHEQEGSLLEYGSSGWQIIKELSLPLNTIPSGRPRRILFWTQSLRWC